ncbi:unnamed protein product, partial [marine sediment metagenome]
GSLRLWWHWKGKYLFTFIFIVGIIVLGIWYSNSSEPVNTFTDSNVKTGVEIKKFPALEEPKTITFQWEYENEIYTITEILYRTAYEYYSSAPKEYICSEGYCPEDWEEYWAKMFLKKVEGDDTISQVASDIKTVG